MATAILWRSFLMQLASNPDADPNQRVLAKAIVDLADAIIPIVEKSDYATQATHSFVCVCPFKPFPHPSDPPHIPFPRKPLLLALPPAQTDWRKRPVYWDGKTYYCPGGSGPQEFFTSTVVYVE